MRTRRSADSVSAMKRAVWLSAVHGIDRILLKGSSANRSRILTKGRGTQTPLISLPTTSPITVQLYNGRTGMCWGADYSVPQMIKNTPDNLKAKTP